MQLLVMDKWGLFIEGKSNLANISNLDPTFELSATCSIFPVVAGDSYHL
jgi:hypothetical protein